MSASLRILDHEFSYELIHQEVMLLRNPDPTVVQQVGKALYAGMPAFAQEVVVTEVEIGLKLQPGFSSTHLSALEQISADTLPSAKLYTAPVFFESHPDWAAVEAHCGLTQSAIKEQLLAHTYTVAMFGFLPGFFYLTGLPKHLQVPRKTIPAKYIAPNSLALGGPYLGIYSLPSPGGWHVIGKLPFSLFNLKSTQTPQIFPGDQIRLNEVDAKTFAILEQSPVNLSTYNAQL